MEKVLLFFNYVHFFSFSWAYRICRAKKMENFVHKKPAPFPEQENQKKTTNKRMVLRDLIYSYEPLTLGEPFSLGYRIRFLQLLFHRRRDIYFIIARI